MAKLIVEWDAGHRIFQLDEQEYQEFLESGEDAEYFFAPIVSDIYSEITTWASVVDE